MQPFGTIKTPKINVQTKKQPPVHRYPVPYSVNQPTVQTTIPSGMPPKITKPAFAEDSTKMSFDPSHTFESQTEFSVTEVHQEREERERTPLQTPDDFRNELGSHHKVNSLEQTPASFGKGQKLEESPIKDIGIPHIGHTLHEPESIKKGITPEKRVIGMRDDDEYVRMASADEEEEEEPIVQKTKERILPSQKAKIDAPRRYQDDDVVVPPMNLNKSLNKTPNISQFEDTNALLKLKRIELELQKEKNRNEFLEAEQMKLINENAELKRRFEELHARVDLAEKYDNRERLAKKEEEAERLKLEVNRLADENRILEGYSQNVLKANTVYRQEFDSIIASQQAEKRRFMEEIQSLKRQLEERENPSNILKERNEILESQLYELRQQVSLLTNQLAMKAETSQKMTDFTEEIQSIVSTLSNVTIQTQTQTAALYSQHAQTSPVKFASKFPVSTTDTQTHPAQVESHHAQTSPLIIENREQSQPSVLHPEENMHNVHPASHVSPLGEVHHHTPPQVGSAEKVQQHQDILPPQSHSHEIETQVHNIVPHFEELKVSPIKEQHQHHFEHEIEGPPKSEFYHIEQQEPSHPHQAPTEEEPHTIHPPAIHPPHHTQALTDPHTSEQQGMLASFTAPETNDKVTGAGLIAPPKYKIPVRPVPKKAVPGFKPMTHHVNPFAEQGAALPEQNISLGVSFSPEKSHEPEIPQQISQPTVEIASEHIEQIPHDVQVVEPEPVQIEQPQHIEQHPPIQEPIKEEKIEEPPRSVLPSGGHVPPPHRPFVPGRPPVKAKVQKIGKNPFSSENEGEPSTLLGSTASHEQPAEVVPSHATTSAHEVAAVPQHEQTLRVEAEDIAKSFSQDQGAAESFFDNLGQNPSQSVDASVPSNAFANQDMSSSDLMRSFQTEESGVNAEKGTEANRAPVAKTVAIKKKKAALPSNMFD